METIRNNVQGEGPGRGRGGITSELINKWGIFSVDMDCHPKEKLFVNISTRFAINVDSLFMRRPEGVCITQLCLLHPFVYKWF